MARHKNGNWNLTEPIPTWEQAQVAVLMDLRDELIAIRCALQSINSTMRCRNFLSIPAKLDAIQRNTAKPKRKKA